MTAQKIEVWIKAGYTLLGSEGMDGIKVERLARMLTLNKSGFYYYFGTMDFYLKSLMQHHVHMAKTIGMEIADCKRIDPDLLKLLVRQKEFFLIESQLLVKKRQVKINADLAEARKVVNTELLELWQREHHQSEYDGSALACLNIIYHYCYARMDAENMNYEFLRSLAVETKEMIEEVFMDKPTRMMRGRSITRYH